MKFNRILNIAIILLIVSSLSCKKDEGDPADTSTELEIKGADISFLPEIRNSGIKLYNKAGIAEDPLTTLRNSGVNTIRLRIWHSPLDGTSSFETVKDLSTEAKALGFKVLLSVHFSDEWTDPANQNKPSSWENLNFTELEDSVKAYTKKIMDEINLDYIQIGNEINNGFLWPEGSLQNLNQMKTLISSASSTIRQSNLKTKIIIHYAGFTGALEFFLNLDTIDYDIIGLSYYPIWHGKSLSSLQSALTSISNTCNKDILIAETSYPFTLGWNDWTNNVIGENNQILTNYPATKEGQAGFLTEIKNIISNTNRGIGFCYWGGEWVSYKGNESTTGSTWENQAIWDFQNDALPVLDVYK